MQLTPRETFALQELVKAAEGIDWQKAQHFLPYAGAAALGLGAYALTPEKPLMWGAGGAALGALGGHMLGQYGADDKLPHEVMGDMGQGVADWGKGIWGGLQDWWNQPPAVKTSHNSPGLLIELLLKHANEEKLKESNTLGASAPGGTVSTKQGLRKDMKYPYGDAK